MISSKEYFMHIEALGVPFNGLGNIHHPENPAEGLRDAGILSSLKARGHTVTDFGDMTGIQYTNQTGHQTGITDYEQWIALSEGLSRDVLPLFSRQAFPLILGGDCSLLVGVFSGIKTIENRVGLIFLDGHADYHTVETSPTGEPADMELAVLTGRGPDSLVNIGGISPLLYQEDALVMGIRARDGIDQSNIRFLDAETIHRVGADTAMKTGLESLPNLSIPFWLHLDVDVLDPSVMPVLFPEPGGLFFDQVESLLRRSFSAVKVIGLSIACYHPSLDGHGRAAKQLANSISNAISDI